MKHILLIVLPIINELDCDFFSVPKTIQLAPLIPTAIEPRSTDSWAYSTLNKDQRTTDPGLRLRPRTWFLRVPKFPVGRVHSWSMNPWLEIDDHLVKKLWLHLHNPFLLFWMKKHTRSSRKFILLTSRNRKWLRVEEAAMDYFSKLEFNSNLIDRIISRINGRLITWSKGSITWFTFHNLCIHKLWIEKVVYLTVGFEVRNSKKWNEPD